jgi:chromosome transmission fidelity protein 1
MWNIYGRRKVLRRGFQVVAVPYNILLHASTREASGLTLTGNIVILDEAHNIIDTITALHSVTLTGQTVFTHYARFKYKVRVSKAID